MAACYRFDPSEGHFTVQGFASGLLSAFAHSPTFAVREYTGEIRFERDEIRSMSLQLAARAASLELLDALRDSDRREITNRMRTEVLETATYSEIAYHSEGVSDEAIAPGQFRLRIDGHLALHGTTRAHRIEARMQFCKDAVRLVGETPLRLSDHGIRPVTALAGAIRLLDELKLTFDLIARLEEP
jgi:polyisoprenoid-binding protein YceI